MSEPSDCSDSVTVAEIENANAKIRKFRDSTFGEGQGYAVFATHELISAKKCDDDLVLEMAPRRARPGETVVYSGSAVRFTVDLKTGAVQQLYLD